MKVGEKVLRISADVDEFVHTRLFMSLNLILRISGQQDDGLRAFRADRLCQGRDKGRVFIVGGANDG